MLLNFSCCVFLVSAFGFSLSQQINLQETFERLSPDLEEFVFSRHRQKPSDYRVLRGLHHYRQERSASLAQDENSLSAIPISVPVDGNDLRLTLNKVNIAHPDLKLRIRHDEGEDEEFSPNLDCFYSGGDNNKWIVVSTCSGINGVIHHAGKSYQLEQIDPKHQGSSRFRRDNQEPIYITYPLNSLRNFEPNAMDSITSSLTLNRPVADAASEGQNFFDSEGRSQRTKRRTIKGPFTVELAIFVDSKLYTYIKNRYPGTESETRSKTMEIIMTLVNAVHRIYNDASLGSDKVSMLVKRVDVLGGKDVPSHSKGDIFKYLKSFCAWQKKENPTASKTHWDHALLLSGHDLWNESPSKNSTVGLAYVGGMCLPSFSCTINEGTSFAAAYIIAHEMGHNFNMKHDGSGLQSKCSADKYIMSPVMSSGATSWSSCSLKSLKKFLKSNGGCLTSEYTTNAKLSRTHNGQVPGKRFNADQQCLYMYGKGWTHFKSSRDPMFTNVCREIWCRNGRLLRTPSASALEGTACATNKVCKKSKCLAASKLKTKKKKTKKKVKKTAKKKKVNKKQNSNNKKKNKKVFKGTTVKEANKGKLKKTKNKKGKSNANNKQSADKKKSKTSNKNGKGKNNLTKNNGDSTVVKSKTKIKKKNSGKPPKYKRIETPTHIIIKERIRFVSGKGWKVKTIKIRKTKKMMGVLDKGNKKKKKKKVKKKKNKANKVNRTNNNKVKINPNFGVTENTSKRVQIATTQNPIPKSCEPKRVRYVENKGWWVKVPINCVKYVVG